MQVRAFRPGDAPVLAQISAACVRTESDFVLNPLWETEEELYAELERHGIDSESHLLVAEADGDVLGMTGYLHRAPATTAGLLCPIVSREERGRGVGGELLRAVLALGADVGIKLVTAGIGTRNRSGYALLMGFGFRPQRQHFLMRCTSRPRVEGVPVPGVALEEAKPEDAAAILGIYHACGFAERSLEDMQRVLGDGRHTHAVARLGGRVAAFAEIESHWPERIWVSFVGVENELRAKGVGSALVAWEVARLFERGTRSALLLLSPANRTALRAYEKVGFQRHRVVDVLEKGL